jgi:hypothetical protein
MAAPQPTGYPFDYAGAAVALAALGVITTIVIVGSHHGHAAEVVRPASP